MRPFMLGKRFYEAYKKGGSAVTSLWKLSSSTTSVCPVLWNTCFIWRSFTSSFPQVYLWPIQVTRWGCFLLHNWLYSLVLILNSLTWRITLANSFRQRDIQLQTSSALSSLRSFNYNNIRIVAQFADGYIVQPHVKSTVAACSALGISLELFWTKP